MGIRDIKETWRRRIFGKGEMGRRWNRENEMEEKGMEKGKFRKGEKGRRGNMREGEMGGKEMEKGEI